MHRKGKSVATLCILTLVTGALSAFSGFEQTIRIGAEEGWSRLQRVEHAELVSGRRGLDVLVLRQHRNTADPRSDLLMSFEEEPLFDETGNYRVVGHSIDISRNNAIRGDGSARFRGDGSGIELETSRGALFHPGRVWDAFSIEFWLHPAEVSDGEQILHWRGSRLVDGETVQQEFRVAFDRRRLVWTFDNLFILPDFGRRRIELESSRRITPRRSAHHLLRFDPVTGAITYLLDGQPQAVSYATETGEPGATVFMPHVGGSGVGALSVGPGYVGLLDGLRIQESYVEEPALERYASGRGLFISEPLDLGRAGSTITAIEVSASEPAGSGVQLYYRVADDSAEFHTPDSAWTAVPDGGEIAAGVAGSVTGRYLQLRGELFPDGAGEDGPAVEAIAVRFLQSRPPGPPGRVNATAGDGEAHIRWDRAPGASVVGYELYYGTRSGDYFGTGADEGDSPLEVGDVREFSLTGLENGRVYFFSVLALDGTRERDGMFSDEVQVRPTAR